MIVGLAGHVDHGKTALVRALTGVDTDRLDEEKRRGITIDLGFAYLPSRDGRVLAFVDVPGHERFVRTMIAGAASVEAALLVVAADDGVMPQTREHLAILTLLGVPRGAVVITKIDRVPDQRLAEVRDEVAALIAPTALATAPVFFVSAIAGHGIDVLKAWLDETAATVARTAGGDAFRLAVDRSFSLPGAGTIVTGAVVSGEVAVGDEVVIAPGGRSARIRSIHAMDRPATHATRGDRCALNLKGPGITPDCTARGGWILAPGHAELSARFDAHVVCLSCAPRPLRQWAPVQLHHGARRVGARVLPLDGDALLPGGDGFVQIVADHPLPVRRDDRIILRDPGGRLTLGGGRVIDAFGPERHRRTPERLALLRQLASPSRADALAGALAQPPYLLDPAALSRGWGVERATIDRHVGTVERIGSGPDCFLVSGQALQQLRGDALDALARLHACHPTKVGLPAADLLAAMTVDLPRRAFASLVAHLVKEGAIASRYGLVSLPEHVAIVPKALQLLHERVRASLAGAPLNAPCVADMAESLAEDEPELRRLCRQMVLDGLVVEIAPDHFYLRSAVRDAAQAVVVLSQSGGAFTTAQFRDALGNGRRAALHLLNYFDRRGFTKRSEGTRRLADVPDRAPGEPPGPW